MKKIIAKFNGKCAETNKQIKKGELMYYDYSTRLCYHLTSTIAQSINTDENLSSLIADQESAYFDNFCRLNNI